MVVLGEKIGDACWQRAEGRESERGLEMHENLNKLSAFTIPDMVEYAAKKHKARPCMGTRTQILRFEEEIDGKTTEKLELGEYTWQSYQEVNNSIQNVAKGVYKLGLKHKSKVVIFAETRADWYISAVGCLKASLTVVTLYSNLNDQGIVHGINETEVNTIFTSYANLPRLVKLLCLCKKIQNIIVFEDQIEGIGNVDSVPESVKVISYPSFLKMGANMTGVEIKGPSPDDTAIIMYTSGSTGNPKGVLLSHKNIFYSMMAFTKKTDLVPNDRYLAYLPLAHILELAAETGMIVAGVSIGYSSPYTLANNSMKIAKGCVGDARLIKPTIMPAVPLMLDRITKGVTMKVEKEGKLKAMIFSLCLRYKKSLNGNNGLLSSLLDAAVFSKVKAELGGEVRVLFAGGAQVSPYTQVMIKCMFGAEIQIGYAATETASCATATEICDNRLGIVGSPNNGTLIKLENWEEGGYKTTDKPQPRGEIHIGGPCVAQGYFKLPTETEEAFYEKDGVRWFRSGDIGEIDGTGCLRIIDRKKDLVKLPHGEYISLGNIEATFKTHSLVENICIFANGTKKSIVAVVVPSVMALKKIASNAGKNEDVSHEDLCNDIAISNLILNELKGHGKMTQLSKWEIPAAIFLSSEEWVPENGLVTASFKIKRKSLITKYSKEVSRMFGTVE